MLHQPCHDLPGGCASIPNQTPEELPPRVLPSISDKTTQGQPRGEIIICNLTQPYKGT